MAAASAPARRSGWPFLPAMQHLGSLDAGWDGSEKLNKLSCSQAMYEVPPGRRYYLLIFESPFPTHAIEHFEFGLAMPQ